MTESITRRQTSVKVRISNGQSLSIPQAIGGHVILGIQMPAVWTAAALTFQGAQGVGISDQAGTGVVWGDVFDDAGIEVSIAAGVALASRVIVNASILEKLAALPAFRIRSGATGAPVAQGADRDIILFLKS